MDDQVAEAVTPEIAAPEQPEAQTPPETVETPKGEDENQRNWREFRKTVSELKRENQYLRQRLDQPPAAPVEPEPQLADDDIVTNKHLKRKVQELEGLIKRKDAETIEERLTNKYDDFNEVVSEENVNLLKQNDPELAASIAALQNDPFKQGIAAYKILKKMDYTPQRQQMQDKVKSDANAKKPVSANAVTKASPLSQANRFANGLTPDLKKALLKEMSEARKGA